MEILGKLFGSEHRVKILQLFLFNPEQVFGVLDIVGRTQVDKRTTSKEISIFKKIGLIKKRVFTRVIHVKKKNKVTTRRRKESGFGLDLKFPYLLPLQTLLLNTALLKNDQIVDRLSRVGKIKLVIISGVFIQDADSRIDLLVVGDNLKSAILEGVIKKIEAEIGKELRYAAFETTDFQYRLGMYDKLIRDILDFSHKTILDKIGLVELR